MSVQSARVQQVVKGDDVVLTHQLMKSVAYNAELSRTPDPLSSGDSVRFFYPLQDQSTQDLIGYPGVAVGSLPSSIFTVAIPGIIAPVSPNLQRGTSMFQSGAGQTVRAEIFRQKATPTADLANNSDTLLNVSSLSNVSIGSIVSGAGIPLGAYVIALPSGSSIQLSTKVTATATGESLSVGQKETQYMIEEVDVLERGFPSSLSDTSGGVNPPQPELNLP